MTAIPGNLLLRVQDGHDAHIAYWARLLDESPAEIRRAIRHAGPELAEVRKYLCGRQLGLDFDSRPAEVAATPRMRSPR